MDVRSTEAAVQRGGLGERVTLRAFLACLLLHSDGVALSLLDRPPVDGYADRLVRLLYTEHSYNTIIILLFVASSVNVQSILYGTTDK